MAIAFLPNRDLILTQRKGKVLIISGDLRSKPREITQINNVKAQGEGGLLGIATHPDFENNKFIYFYYTYGGNGNDTLNRVSRFEYVNDNLINERTIVDKIPGNSNHNGGRIKFGPDELLYIGTGDAQEPSLSQNKNSLAGKILRVTDEGKPAPDNPFGNQIYSYGHRNVQGLAWDNDNNLWATEHGNSTRDELNKIEKGGNYGWPEITGDQTRSGMITGIINSGDDTWAPSGLAFYKDSLYFAGLRGSALFKFDIGNKSLNKLFDEKYGRIREAITGPDGALYILTNNTDGRGILKPGDDKLIRLDL